MKIKVLGTAACEGVPAMFCNCENCVKARQLKGKNLRARTQALINEDLLVDFHDDTYLNGQRFGLDLTKIKYFLITHAHCDHLSPWEFDNLNAGVNKVNEQVYVLGGRYILDEMIRVTGNSIKTQLEKGMVTFIELKPFETTDLGAYAITPLPANHAGNKAMVYVIENQGKRVFYCLDTGKLSEETFEFMKGIKPFDLVVLDCTYGRVPADKYGGHLSLYDGANQVKKMKESGVVTDKTQILLTHFAHWHIPSHEDMQRMADEFGYEVSYDGIEKEI
jgi:phosphoribosyl 1,2-cyclic phosphate phosphodiesterase